MLPAVKTVTRRLRIGGQYVLISAEQCPLLANNYVIYCGGENVDQLVTKVQRSEQINGVK